MNKELEALKLIGYVNYEDNEGYETCMETYFKKEFKLLKQALTPPTEQEVCEALSEYLNTLRVFRTQNIEVFYKEGKYIYTHDNTSFFIKIAYINSEGLLCSEQRLPPHLMEMICKFYKGVKE